MENKTPEGKKYRPPALGGFKVFGPRLEQKLTNMCMNSNVLRSFLSFFFMPLAHKLSMKVRNNEDGFYVEVPHKRFNRNAYGTIAGAALLANLELAAGAFLVVHSNSKYRLVCRNVDYSFKLPSTNGIHFAFESADENFEEMVDANVPFNATVKVTAYSLGEKSGEPGRRIGRGKVCFHLWPVPGLLS